jgi:hypothetical protein
MMVGIMKEFLHESLRLECIHAMKQEMCIECRESGLKDQRIGVLNSEYELDTP